MKPRKERKSACIFKNSLQTLIQNDKLKNII